MKKVVMMNEAQFYLAAKEVFMAYHGQQNEDTGENSIKKSIRDDATKKLQLCDKEYITVKELMAYTGYERSTIYQYVHRKEIPFKKRNAKLFFKLSEIREWIEDKQK